MTSITGFSSNKLEAYLELSQTSKMELFCKKQLTIFSKKLHH